MSQAKSDLLNACHNGNVSKIQQLLHNNMFSQDVYYKAADLCVRAKQLKAFHLVVDAPHVSTHPAWSWDGLGVAAMENDVFEILEFCVAQASQKQRADLYNFSIIMDKVDGFQIIDQFMDDNIRSSFANNLDRSAEPCIVRRLFPFCTDCGRTFMRIFWGGRIDLCVELVQMRPHLKTWLEEQLNSQYLHERAYTILNLVQRAEISAQMPENATKLRKM